jgi:hypothetical protein
LRRADDRQLRRGSSALHLQLQRRARWQCLWQARGDNHVANLERHHPVGRLAEDKRLEHLPRPEQRCISRRGARDDLG